MFNSFATDRQPRETVEIGEGDEQGVAEVEEDR